MKKLPLVWKKYINRVSVLITVFSVLMTASFYNPASLAAESVSIPMTSMAYRLGGLTTSIYDRGKAKSFTVYSVPESSDSYYTWVQSVAGSNGNISSTNTPYYRASASYLFKVPFNVLIFGDNVSVIQDNDHFTADGRIEIPFSVEVMKKLDGFQWQINSVSSSVYSGDSILSTIEFDGSRGVITLYFDDCELTKIPGDNNLSAAFGEVQFRAYAWSFGGHGDNFPADYECALKFTGRTSWNDWIAFYLTPGYSENGLKGIGDNVQSIKDGYDSSSGNASQSKLDISMSGQDAKEDSLFTSASGNLSNFSLTDISVMPKVVAGLSFVSSTMTSIFEALGGVNGAGIVLSVGCSILFVSFCIGAYKFYSGGKD